PGLPGATGGRGCGAGIDYLAQTATVTLAPGTTRRVVPVTICGDGVFEPDERLTLRVTSVSGALFGTDSTKVGVIVNDDAKPVITVETANDGMVTEGTGGTTVAPITIRISTSQHSGAAIKLVRRGSAEARAQCGGPADLAAASDTIRVNWPAGNGDSWTVNLSICGDDRDEGNDLIEIVPAVVTNAEVAPGSLLRRIVIFDDDPPPSIAVMDLTVTEGNLARVEVRLSAPSDQVVEVRLATSTTGFPSGASVATAGEACAGTVDFVMANRRVSVPAGKSVATLDIMTCPNGDFSTDPAAFPGPGYSEVFRVVASDPANGTLVKPVAVVTVRDP
ncbi:MAG: hypothetical protein IT352_16930, partial [Gemmatimonadales bacterium]|nr:hypothetical protein [Gemmatimonadales bacterium]